uniref:Flavoprotein domain-containing protein n=1 Tax=Caenorhabditis japonica TaxID=281687 RepID=A0A8R1HWK3_CAEJA
MDDDVVVIDEDENEKNGEETAEIRPPLTRSHKITRESSEKHNLLLILTGSIAVMKVTELISTLYEKCGKQRLSIKVVTTENAMKLLQIQKLELDEMIYEDRDEWSMWRERGDPVLHIELRKWADSALIAPLDANTLAKIANGLCDNLVTSVIRAWDLLKPCYFAPAMNTHMWENPLTLQHRNVLKSQLKFKEICPIQKELICGDTGQGAMASVGTITSVISALVRDQLAIRSKGS